MKLTKIIFYYYSNKTSSQIWQQKDISIQKRQWCNEMGPDHVNDDLTNCIISWYYKSNIIINVC